MLLIVDDLFVITSCNIESYYLNRGDIPVGLEVDTLENFQEKNMHFKYNID